MIFNIGNEKGEGAMSAVQPFCYLIGINPQKLSKQENILLEAIIFVGLCDVLKEFFKEQHKTYFKLMKFTVEMENAMIDAHFMRLIINDILKTGEYSLEGIAYYMDLPQEVVCEVAAGHNTNPSAIFFQKTLALHCEVKRDFYQEIIKTIFKKMTIEID